MIFWVFWFIIGALTISSFACIILPKFYLKAIDVLYTVKDRAVAQFNISDGVSFLYEPEQTAKKYIERYQIYSLGDKKKRFIGEWARSFRQINYNIVAYDKQNEIIDIINVNESFNSGRFTHSTVLPNDTDFVSLKINKADGERVYTHKSANTPFYLWLYAFAASVALVVDLFLWLVVEFVFKCVTGATALSLSTWTLVLSIVGLIITLVVFLGASVFLFYLNGEPWKK